MEKKIGNLLKVVKAAKKFCASFWYWKSYDKSAVLMCFIRADINSSR